MANRCFQNVRAGRRAFTLLEVLLALALLVIVTAFAWPALEKPFATARLKSAAEEVRAAWTSARVEAINSGEIFMFRFVAEGDLYRVESYAAVDPEASDLGLTSEGSGNAYVVPAPKEEVLPEGMVFMGSETSLDTRQTSVAAELGDQRISLNESWSDPVLFYPDGTTSTTRLVLKNEYERYVRLDLRGLTGVITVSRVLSAQEMAQ